MRTLDYKGKKRTTVVMNEEGWFSSAEGTREKTKKYHFKKKFNLRSICNSIEIDPARRLSMTVMEEDDFNQYKVKCKQCIQAIEKEKKTLNIQVPDPYYTRRLSGKLKHPKKIKNEKQYEPLSWKISTCSQPGCNFKGIHPTVPSSTQEKHYCPQHNPKIEKLGGIVTI